MRELGTIAYVTVCVAGVLGLGVLAWDIYRSRKHGYRWWD